MTPDEHTVSLYIARRTCWALCACGWQSITLPDRSSAQSAWANHIAELVKPDVIAVS